MACTFTQCKKNGVVFEGLYEIQPRVFGDDRGYFIEAYSKKDFADAGLTMEFVQDNQSLSSRGVLRGLHFQTRHPQGKLVRVVSGKVYDVAVDLRNGSPSFGMYYGVVLSGEKQNQFYIPEGFAHGFYVLSDTAVFTYKCTDFYDPQGEGGLPWNDPVIGVDWQAAAADCGSITPLLSPKDGTHPAFRPDDAYFDRNGRWIGRA